MSDKNSTSSNKKHIDLFLFVKISSQSLECFYPSTTQTNYQIIRKLRPRNLLKGWQNFAPKDMMNIARILTLYDLCYFYSKKRWRVLLYTRSFLWKSIIKNLLVSVIYSLHRLYSFKFSFFSYMDWSTFLNWIFSLWFQPSSFSLLSTQRSQASKDWIATESPLNSPLKVYMSIPDSSSQKKSSFPKKNCCEHLMLKWMLATLIMSTARLTI